MKAARIEEEPGALPADEPVDELVSRSVNLLLTIRYKDVLL
jgi:hypothetical protein